MLLRVDQQNKNVDCVIGTKLLDFGLDERGLQDILFRTLDRLVGNDELQMLAQSRHWQEEPDLLALDRDGNLNIFEIKVWEARQENLLQVLRYGQLNGKLDMTDCSRYGAEPGEKINNFRKHTARSLTSSYCPLASIGSKSSWSSQTGSTSKRVKQFGIGRPLGSTFGPESTLGILMHARMQSCLDESAPYMQAFMSCSYLSHHLTRVRPDIG